ncbi:unnamed protein product [Linum tenue]|uniref:Uncharacterized protein n=1 Tax=Linum tenue TaxID=586396 RepID=A0AAV0IV33_9ROSI|nr:unnamed protein product [Linum tenue]
MHEILETDHVDESDDEGAVYKYYTAKASTKKERKQSGKVKMEIKYVVQFCRVHREAKVCSSGRSCCRIQDVNLGVYQLNHHLGKHGAAG